MCTYTSGNNRCTHHRDYDPVIKIRNIDLPEGISLIDEGYVDENMADPEIEEINDYIGHEMSYMTKKILNDEEEDQIGYSVSRNIVQTSHKVQRKPRNHMIQMRRKGN